MKTFFSAPIRAEAPQSFRPTDAPGRDSDVTFLKVHGRSDLLSQNNNRKSCDAPKLKQAAYNVQKQKLSANADCGFAPMLRSVTAPQDHLSEMPASLAGSVPSSVQIRPHMSRKITSVTLFFILIQVSSISAVTVMPEPINIWKPISETVHEFMRRVLYRLIHMYLTCYVR